MHDIFNISKLIIKKKLKILSDSEKSRLKQFNKNYPFLKDLNFESLVDKISEFNKINNDVAWEAILEKSNKGKLKAGISIFRESWFKYAAVASIVLLFSLSYLVMNKATQENKAVIAEPVIEIGTDKATLTLEDGSTVILEKGATYQANNINSNGEQIIYDAVKNTAKSEIAYNYLTIPRGGQFFAKLSDGTEVWLNSESQLKYPVTFIQGETRQVELVYGEAYFDVSSSSKHNGSKFKVFTQGQEVEVLGTEFNIKAYPDESSIYTTLLEGSVVMSAFDKKKMLVPGQQSVLNKETKDVLISRVKTSQVVAWKNGLFSFDDKTLKEIMTVMSRWYDVDIVFDDKSLELIKFKGQLNKDQNIEDILNLIKNSNYIDAYEIKDHKVILK